MAKSQQERSKAAAEKRQRMDETELRHRVRRGTRAMLENLMRWHGIEEQAEAIQLLIMHAHDLGPEGSAPLLAIPRHDFTPSDFVARQLERLGRKEAELLDRSESRAGPSAFTSPTTRVARPAKKAARAFRRTDSARPDSGG